MPNKTDINWNNFQAKFNGQEQGKFELLCYLLFCNEFNRPNGIFRYFNQAGIETEPIEHEGDNIGFQAKFLTNGVSGNKDLIINGIDKAKRDNPNLNKLLFYTHKEISMNQKEHIVPKYKTDIENHARSLDIVFVWRVPSHFEAQLMQDSNSSIREYFFSLDHGIIEAIENLFKNTQHVLNPIKMSIDPPGKNIHFDRSIIINQVKVALRQSHPVILHGLGGVGKTAIIKEILTENGEYDAYYVVKTSEFNVDHESQLFSSYNSLSIETLNRDHNQSSRKLFVFDSAEALSDFDNRSPFNTLVAELIKAGWSIIFTVRTRYYDDLIRLFDFKTIDISLPSLTIDELDQLSHKHNFSLPSNERVIDYVRIPKYLSEYLNLIESDQTNSLSDFKESIWKKRIEKSDYQKNNLHQRRARCFMELVIKRCEQRSYYLPVPNDSEAYSALVQDEILENHTTSTLCFITHDIYEEWALDMIIEFSFAKHGNFNDMFNEIGSSLPVRRAFREWLFEKLISGPSGFETHVLAISRNTEIPSYWIDEILVSLLLSSQASLFLNLLKPQFAENDNKLLKRLIFLLRTACKEPDVETISQISISSSEFAQLKTKIIKPRGSGWEYVIGLLVNHAESDKFPLLILSLLEDWTTSNHDGATTKQAGIWALHYYKNCLEPSGYFPHHFKSIEKSIVRVILYSSGELKEEITAFYDDFLSGKQLRLDPLSEKVLTSLAEASEFIKALPNLVIRLMNRFWLKDSSEKKQYSEMHYFEEALGLSSNFTHVYHPVSALQTPLSGLLRFHPQAALDFIVEFTNQAVENYSQSRRKDEIEEIPFVFNDGAVTKQYIGGHLWGMYRGHTSTSNCIESVHMALERWLLQEGKHLKSEVLEGICLYLLKKSKSASISAVILSVVQAYPEKLFNIAVVFIRIRELYVYDTQRMLNDQRILSIYSMYYGQHRIMLYQDERIRTCDDYFRKLRIENLVKNYQFITNNEKEETARYRDIIWGILDDFYRELPLENEQRDEDRDWRLFLARMDLRGMEQLDNGKVVISPAPDMDDNLKQYSEQSQQQIADQMIHVPLKLWAEARFRKDSETYTKYENFEQYPITVYSEAKLISDRLINTDQADDREFRIFYSSVPMYVCAVLLIDFHNTLNEEIITFCQNTIFQYADYLLSDNYQYQTSDGSEPTIRSLCLILQKYPCFVQHVKKLLLKILLEEYNIAEFARYGISNMLWEENESDVKSLIFGYLKLVTAYQEYRRNDRMDNLRKGNSKVTKSLLNAFVEENSGIINSVLDNSILAERIVIDGIDFKYIISAMQIMPSQVVNDELKQMLINIIKTISDTISKDFKRDYYSEISRFFKKFRCMLFFSDHEDIKLYLDPIIKIRSFNRYLNQLFDDIIEAEDIIKKPDLFWIIWDIFFDQVKYYSKVNQRQSEDIVKSYLIAFHYCIDGIKEWHSLRPQDLYFYDKVVEMMGANPVTLLSIAKVLNGIASHYWRQGINWLATLIINNSYVELPVNTIYYIEEFMHRCSIRERKAIRQTKQLRDNSIQILNFIIEHGSCQGFLVREEIL